MRREYKKKALFDSKRIGMGAFTLFIVFVALKILTPPSTVMEQADAPDGSKTARLRMFYYDSHPSYKIDYHEDGKLLWLNLLYLPSATNTPPETATKSLAWSPGSERIDFLVNGTSVWHHAFE